MIGYHDHCRGLSYVFRRFLSQRGQKLIVCCFQTKLPCYYSISSMQVILCEEKTDRAGRDQVLARQQISAVAVKQCLGTATGYIISFDRIRLFSSHARALL